MLTTYDYTYNEIKHSLDQGSSLHDISWEFVNILSRNNRLNVQEITHELETASGAYSIPSIDFAAIKKLDTTTIKGQNALAEALSHLYNRQFQDLVSLNGLSIEQLKAEHSEGAPRLETQRKFILKLSDKRKLNLENIIEDLEKIISGSTDPKLESNNSMSLKS